MKSTISFLAASMLLMGGISPVHAAGEKPRLIVAISVDQFSADLFSEYRAHFTHGLKILQQGTVFPNGYQSHAATETCPGHATILTGARPARNGIIANNWVDYTIKREEKTVYCAEDETSKTYKASARHLMVPTLGDRMKEKYPDSRVVAVAGKDRAALMMGGKNTDQVWWWSDKGGLFSTLDDRKPNAASRAVNDKLARMIRTGLPALPLPDFCRSRPPIALPGGKTVSTPPAALPPEKLPKGMKVRPEVDRATVDLAIQLTDELGLGQRAVPDLLAVSLSVTDYVGHTFGTEGTEMCVQMMALDQTVETLLSHLDGLGVPYAVVLTADHGGHDIAERNSTRAIPDDRRLTDKVGLAALNAAMGHAKDPVFRVDDKNSDVIAGDLYLNARVKGQERAELLSKAKDWFEADARKDMIAGVFTSDELQQVKPSTLPPEAWTLAERAAASVYPGRSGDLVVLLKPRISPIRDAKGSYIATHGSTWDYDRRVPILFWQAGMTGFEQPNSIETVDIMPTLAGLIGLPLKPGEVDGQCRDLDAGPESTCPSP
jgi:alkaline phosphatase